MYNVFVRTFWKWQYNQYGQKTKTPHLGRKSYLARNISEDIARRICKEYNESHNPGELSRKAEYESR